MKVIPVIDILNGLAVHAVRGRRQEYQPLQSSLCKSTKPLEVAKAFKTLGFSDLYIADLDAITGSQVNFQTLNCIADETGLRLMVDAGVANLETAEKLLGNRVSKIIVGTETLENKGFVGEAMRIWGNDRIIVSLDFKGEKVLVKLGFKGCKDPLCLLGEFRRMGVLDFIVLDLTRVGSCEGVNLDFLKKALEENVNVYVGGGVRDIDDLIWLENLGVSGVLVATALHSGKISIQDLKKNKMI
ncbi:MAG: HisA/HisF-related TIM barrel protein [Candidatus Bathyarchaeia archaeon]